MYPKNYRTYSPERISYKYLNENGSQKEEIKSELKLFNQIGQPQVKNENIINKAINLKSSLNLKNNNFNDAFDIIDKSKHLEFNQDNSNQYDNIYHIPNLQERLYKNQIDIKSHNQIMIGYPFISTLFTKRIDEINYIDIFSNNEIIRKSLSESCEHRPLISNNIIKKNRHNNSPNLKISINCENKEIIKNEKLIFNDPENFLINFNLSDIKINDIQYTQNEENSFTFISLKDMEKFINYLCKNIVNINETDNLSFIGEDYIVFKKCENEEENIIPFLQRKRNNILYFDDTENTYNDKSHNLIKRTPLKKKCKNKNKNKKISEKRKRLNRINNKKDGEKINIYLNQIKINKNKLINFPFFPMIGNKEIFKIEILKGVLDKKSLIRVNKKPILIKDKRNLKYINNKKFELIYINKEYNSQYIVYIKGFNILNLILYYYYQIQEGIRFINKLHYSHAPFHKSVNVIKGIERMIKQCNKIVVNISNIIS